MKRPTPKPRIDVDAGDSPNRDELHPALVEYFARKGWTPFAYQLAACQAYRRGASGLINAPTGVGKTLSAWLGPLDEALHAAPLLRDDAVLAVSGTLSKRRTSQRDHAAPLSVLWITPLRALAADTAAALAAPVKELGLAWTVEMRTGDTPQSLRGKQKLRLPSALVTTPESLTLLLSYPNACERFGNLKAVIVDEWHELLGSKRGVQLELALARLRGWLPKLRTWGVSATLGNLEQARDVLLGPRHDPHDAVLIKGDVPKALLIDTLIPTDIERFPWAGHLGTRLAKQVVNAIDAAGTTLLFTNTRAQAELWFARLLAERDDLLGGVAIHHGSLEKELRRRVEGMLAEGKLRCVVCTSSLDLGVDFQPVDQVLQVGSPKGVARLLQRAGRSGHRPGAVSRVMGVPTHAFELVEFAAARAAAQATPPRVESRHPVERPLDVLVQHLVTIACAGGFTEHELLEQVRSTHAFARLAEDDWQWCMDFVARGGSSLSAYPQFSRIRQTADQRWVVSSERTARTHRFTIGTITGQTSLNVKYLSGRRLGHIEENFIARLVPGDRFIFSGRVLEFIRLRDGNVFVERSRKKSGIIPRWDGGRFSLSSQLADAVRGLLDDARRGIYAGPEMQAVKPLLELQLLWSRLPAPTELLVETIATGEAYNILLYPFAGRTVHEGLGALLAYRLTRLSPTTITATCNDYGICLSSADPIALSDAELRRALASDNLMNDLIACMNSSIMARRQFRDIARIAGLVVSGYPGQNKPARHLQASSEMFYDVFAEFDPDNRLLAQAGREVLETQLEAVRLRETLDRLAGYTLVQVQPKALTPLAFPIWAENLRASSITSEKFSSAVAKMVLELESLAGRSSGERPRLVTSARGKRPGHESADTIHRGT